MEDTSIMKSRQIEQMSVDEKDENAKEIPNKGGDDDDDVDDVGLLSPVPTLDAVNATTTLLLRV